MKTVVLGLILIGFTNLMHSQNELAYVKVDIQESVKPVKHTAINSSYYTAFNNKVSSQRVRKFQNLVANYDIKNAAIYASDERSSYTILFEEGGNTIEAEYNQEGKIVQCKEQFKGIKLPYTISSDIAKKYPGWGINEVWCHISYSHDSDQEIIYKVAIQNGTKMKTLKLNTADYIF